MPITVKLRIALLGTLLCIWPCLVCAGTLETIRQDLAPKQGVIVMPLEGEYLVDLDASKGIVVGDFLSVMGDGAPIIHPVSGEQIGTLQTPKAILQVTKVKSGYAYAERRDGQAVLSKGEELVSYRGVPGCFWDYTSKGEGVYTALREGLPHLEWLDYAESQRLRPAQPTPLPDYHGVIFVLSEEALDVRDGTNTLIRHYPVPSFSGMNSSQVNPGIIPSPEAQNNAAIQLVEKAGVWTGPEVSGLLSGVAVGNFDGDPGNEIISATRSELALGRLEGQSFTELATLALDQRLRILSLEAFDYDHDGRDELYVSAVESPVGSDIEHLASLWVEVENGRLVVRQSDIAFFIGSVELYGEGRILLGQRLGELGRTYADGFVRLVRRGSKLAAGDEVKLPGENTAIHSVTLLSISGQEPLSVQLDRHEKLEVYTQNGLLKWESDQVQGGTEGYIGQHDPDNRSGVPMYVFTRAPLKTVEGLVLVPVNEGSSRLTSSRKFTESRVIAYRWGGRSLQEVWQTAAQGGGLAGFTVADADNDGRNEIVMAVIFSHGTLWGGHPSSSLVVYELP